MCMRKKTVCRRNSIRFATAAQSVSNFSFLSSARFVAGNCTPSLERRTSISPVLVLSAIVYISLSFLPINESRDIIVFHGSHSNLQNETHLPQNYSNVTSTSAKSGNESNKSSTNAHRGSILHTRLSPGKRSSRHKVRNTSGMFPLYGFNTIESEHPLYGSVEQSEPCFCWNSTMDGSHGADFHHGAEVDCKCTGPLVTELVTPLRKNALSNVSRITVDKATNFTTLGNEDLRMFSKSLAQINLDQLPLFREIKPGTFTGMGKLDSIYIVGAPSLTSIHPDVFNVFLPKLRSIRIVHSSLEMFPKLNKLRTSHQLSMLDLENNKINRIEPGSLDNLQVEHLILSYNSLTEIGPSAFGGSTIARLTLKGNRDLTNLHPDSFKGIDSLQELDLSDTAITFLPVEGLNILEILRVQNVPTLRVIPSIYRFVNLKEAWLTWAYHCCAFDFPETHDPDSYKKYLAFKEKADLCQREEAEKAITASKPSVIEEKTLLSTGEPGKPVGDGRKSGVEAPYRKRRHSSNSPSSSVHSRRMRAASANFNSNNNEIRNKRLHDGPGIGGEFVPDESHQSFYKKALALPPLFDSFDPFAHDTDKSFHAVFESSEPNSEGHKGGWSQEGSHHSEKVSDGEHGHFHEGVTVSPPVVSRCGNVSGMRSNKVKCQPYPDAFNPCEDIMGSLWLRGAVWVVVGLALIGNTAVLVVLILAPGRMSVQRFLMANLSCADLCMGIYLLMVATQDLISLGSYFNFAIDWQLGWGCKIAGFLTVFASELSVFTLAIITAERWYALTRAIHLTKRLTIVGAAQLMSIGWLLAISLAAMPLLGVSSYSKTSICLPMDAETAGAQGYLAFLLCFNGIAFTLVACAYWHMYRAVAGHGTSCGSSQAAQSADAAIAKKMGLLVFTDFACWAPVAFFGLTAVAGSPLIGVTDSKILLVFFYPLNACCNPYLYAILTKQYRRDLLLLLSSHGMCTKRAARCKTGAVSTNNTMQTILRAGSIAETKVANSDVRISRKSAGGAIGCSQGDLDVEESPALYPTLESIQLLHQDSYVKAVESAAKNAGNKSSQFEQNTKFQRNGSPCTPFHDENGDDDNNIGEITNGKPLMAETSFITLTPSIFTGDSHTKPVGYTRKQDESTGATAPHSEYAPSVNNSNMRSESKSHQSFPNSMESNSDDHESDHHNHEISEMTPFCVQKSY